MTRFYIPAPIEHPDLYAAAIKRNRYANAAARRRAELEQAAPDVAAWLASSGYVDDGAPVYDDDLQDERQPRKEHPAGAPPAWLLDAYSKWGGLTEKQLAVAQRMLGERTEKRAEWAAKRAAEKANAAHWTPGRQVVEGTLVSFRFQENDFGGSYKGLVKMDDGRTLWSTIPMLTAEDGSVVAYADVDRLTFTVKVEPKADDPTFAFGSRPTKAALVSRKATT